MMQPWVRPAIQQAALRRMTVILPGLESDRSAVDALGSCSVPTFRSDGVGFVAKSGQAIGVRRNRGSELMVRKLFGSETGESNPRE